MRRKRTVLLWYAEKIEVLEFTSRTEKKVDLVQWWFEDADGAKRCFATSPMLPNVCNMDTEHGFVQLDVIDR